MIIAKAWTNKLSASFGLFVLLVSLLWPAIPLRSLDIWLATLTGRFPTNLFYPILAILVGSFVAIYVYNKYVHTCCPVGSGKSGGAASLFGVLLGACPACIPALGFFLPLGVTVTLGYFSWVFLLGSVALLTFSIYRMNGFKSL
ncbi:MAG: hypothetical protein WD231_04475 [Candidatus Woykebacteria bacterium]